MSEQKQTQQTQNSGRKPLNAISEGESGQTRGKSKYTLFEIYTEKSHFLLRFFTNERGCDFDVNNDVVI